MHIKKKKLFVLSLQNTSKAIIPRSPFRQRSKAVLQTIYREADSVLPSETAQF